MKWIRKIYRFFKYLPTQLPFHPLVATAIFKIFRGTIPSRGFLIDVNNPYISKRSIARLFWQRYETDEIQLLNKFLHRDLDVVELGSGIGVISLEILRIQEPCYRLICVEPNPYLMQTLEQNIQRNTPGRKVVILNQALDYSGPCEVGLSITADNLGSKIRHDKRGVKAFIESITLTKLLKKYELGEFALICDVEGAEAGMLFEDGEALTLCRQMLIELHPTAYKGQDYTIDRLCARIESHGFRLLTRQRRVHVFTRSP